MKNYFKESYNELVHKVSWPSWAELQGSAGVVMIASVVFAVMIFGMDTIFQNVMRFVYSLLY